jgi:hypothetical protein
LPVALIILNRRNIGIKKVGIVPAHSIKSSIGQAVRQVAFTSVLIVGRLNMDGQSCAPIGLHKTDAASDWLLIKRIGTKGLPGVQLQNLLDYIGYPRDFSIYRKEDVLYQLKIRCTSEKSKKQLRPLWWPRFVNFSQHFRNLSRKTVP